MGTKTRDEPQRLATKLRQIRLTLGLTQEEMRRRLDYGSSPSFQRHISEFENGRRVPSLLTLLNYSELSGVSINIMVDDQQDIPEKLSAKKRGGST